MNGTQTLDRALDILFALAEAQCLLTVTQIAEKAAIPESTAYRFLQTLEQNGLIERKGKGQIGLGLRILELARSVHQQIDRQLLDLARPLMEGLTETTGETCILAIRSGLSAICVQAVESSKLIRLSIENGRILPLHSGATGKAILAFESAKITDQVIESLPETERPQLLRDLSAVRKAGFCTTVGEVDLDVFGIAAPVFDSHDHALASLTIAGPMSRYQDSPIIAQTICEAARSLSIQMGQMA